MATFRVRSGAVRIFGRVYKAGVDCPIDSAKMYKAVRDHSDAMVMTATDEERAAFEAELTSVAPATAPAAPAPEAPAEEATAPAEAEMTAEEATEEPEAPEAE